LHFQYGLLPQVLSAAMQGFSLEPGGIANGPSVQRLRSTAVWFDCYFVGAGELSGDIETKLRRVMRILAVHRSSVFEELEPSP
jgi:hypothetical protein